MVTLGSGSMLALEGGIVRGVRRSSGGVPRSTQGGGADSASAAQNRGHANAGRARARHLRSARSSHRVRISGQQLRVPPEFSSVRRSQEMAAHGLLHNVSGWPGRPQPDRDGVGQQRRITVRGERTGLGRGRLIGRPAILDMPEGKGHVVAFNFNPLHRDLSRGDQRLVWNALLNWEAILAGMK